MTKEEAIELFKDVEVLVFRDVKQKYFHEDIEEAFKLAIKALEQEPKTGHWIATGDYFTGAYSSIDYVKCSCCGYESLEEGDYCPNCGARMEN